jgi:hypothetical protein
MTVCGGFYRGRIVAQLNEPVGKVPGGARTAERQRAMDGAFWQCNPAPGHKGEFSWADENTEKPEQMVIPAAAISNLKFNQSFIYYNLRVRDIIYG